MTGAIVLAQSQTVLWRAIFVVQGWFCCWCIVRTYCWSFLDAWVQIYADLILKLTGTSITDINRICQERVIPTSKILTKMIRSLILVPYWLNLVASDSWGIDMVFCKIVLIASTYWGTPLIFAIKIALSNVGVGLVAGVLVIFKARSMRKSYWTVYVEYLCSFELISIFVSFRADSWHPWDVS